jgi:hypothetical protein
MKLRILFIAFFISAFSWGQIIYQDNFGTTAISTKPYTGTPTTADANLNTFSWTTSAANFGILAGNGGAPSQSLSLSNSSGTPTMTFTFNVAAGFELSVTQFDFWRVRSGTGAQNWAMTINGTSVGTGTIPTTGALLGATNVSTPINGLTGTITIIMTYSGASGFGTCRLDDFTLYGFVTSTATCSNPASQASTYTVANRTTIGANISWTPGATAAGSIVVIRPASAGSAPPVNGTNYTPNTNYGTAAQINIDNRVVYRSNGSTVTGITGLTAGTEYVATVYAYNGSGTNICYNTTTPETINFWTLGNEPTGFGTGFSGCITASTTSITLNFAAANTIPNATGYLILYRENALPTGLPVDGVIYTLGSIIGDSTVGDYAPLAAISRTITGLNTGTTYFFLLIPHGSNVSPETLNYRTVPIIPSTSCNTTLGPEMNVRGVIGTNPTIPDNDITPQGTDNTLFATVVVGNNQAKNFRIENTGNAVLNITSITMVGGNPGDFVVSGITLPTTIAALASLDFTVTFSPTAAGIRNTTLTIVNNDSNENPYNFVIQGTGTLVALVDINVRGNGQTIPDNSIYPQGTNHTAFGIATVGVTTVVRTFTIENTGSTALTLTNAPNYVTVTGPHASMFTLTAQPSSNTIAGGASLTFIITFNPTSPGAKNATVIIASTDPDENPYNFNISGTAKGTNNIYTYGNGNDVVKGAITTATANLTNFGSVAVTTGIKQNTFVISNLSGVTTYFNNAVVSGADAAMFTVVAQPTNNGLGSGNSTSFTVNFTPTTIGIKNATITFTVFTDAARTIPEPIDPVYTFAISGEGIVFTPCTNNAVQTIAIQDFEVAPATPTYGYSYTTDGTVSLAGGTYNNGSTPRNAFIGAQSFQMAGIGTTSGPVETSVITMAPINVSQFNNINLSLKIGAFRTGTTQGLDINEFIQIETSIDGGTNWSTESVLRAYSNSRWDFAAAGVFNAYYTGTNNGATIDTRNGNAELANGIATYNVRNLPSVPNLLIRITLVVDRADEIWAIDDIRVEGQLPVSSTWNGFSWTPSAPTSSTKAIFDGNFDTSVNGNVQACECEIRSGRTVLVAPSNFIESQSNITNSGTLTIANNGSLIQVNDGASNTGNIIYQRTATGIRGSDYVYWSSPVTGQSVDNIYSSPTPGFKYKWNPLAININSPLSSGIWEATSGVMDVGTGYIVRGSSNFSMAASSIPAVFTGPVNNGVIPVTISRGSNTTPSTLGSGNGITFTNFDDNWNLVGNPYPSAIRALAFLNANPNIRGFIYLWTHNTAIGSATNPFYGSFLYNYSSNDYITYNGTATTSGPIGPPAFNGNIAGGQGFFVLMNDGATGSSTINFRNSMRSNAYANNQFYRNSINEEEDKHRIWLDLLDSNNIPARTVIGYVPEATNGLDRLYDAYKNTANERSIYSLVENESQIIQGRSLPFDTNDTVEIGVRIMQQGEYKIAIGAVDGLFSDAAQNIYIEDKQLGVIHDLRQNPYIFTASAGIFNDRFVLRYERNALGNPDFGTVTSVIVSSNNGQLSIKSSVETIENVIVYDILGRELFQSKSIGQKDYTTSKISKSHQALIVKIKLENGAIVTRKIVL